MSIAPNYNDILSAYQAYASPMRPYLLYAETRPEIQSKFTRKLRLAFIDLVARTNIANPAQPILVRVDQTAARLEISEKSVYRAIKLMIQNGWLTPSRTHDGRNNNGEFAWKEYLVTTTLRTLLRMPTGPKGADIGNGPPPPPEPTTGTVVSSAVPEGLAARNGYASTASPAQLTTDVETMRAQSDYSGFQRKTVAALDRIKATLMSRSAAAKTAAEAVQMDIQPSDISDQAAGESTVETNLSTGLIYAVNNSFFKKEASLQRGAFEKEASIKENLKPHEGVTGHQPSLQSEPATGKVGRVPRDLLELCDLLGIRPQGVFSLLTLAKKHGHRLQDVWKVKREYLLNVGAKDGRAVALLRKLLTCGDDYSYLARTKIDAPKPIQHALQAPTTPIPIASDAVKPDSVETAAKPASAIAGIALHEIEKSSRYKQFQHRENGARVRVFDGCGEVIHGLQAKMLGGWEQMQQVYLDIFRGVLVEVRC